MNFFRNLCTGLKNILSENFTSFQAILLTSLTYDSDFQLVHGKVKMMVEFFVLIWGGAISFTNYKTKYAHYSMFMLEPISHLGAQQVDALNFFSKFLFVWLVIFWIIWVQTLKILSLTQPVFKYIILRYKTTNTVFIAMLFGCTFRLYWAHCVRYKRSVKVPNLFTEEDQVGEENSDILIVCSRASGE